MNTKAPVSLCLIVKNEPLLERCILSIKDYVSEIVIVDTGSSDGTDLIAKKYADIYEKYTDCNDPATGLINNFSQARKRSFDLSNQPWVLWCDADDIIDGGENLQKIINEYSSVNYEAIGVMFPYEYSYDENGKCTCRHYRERLVSNKKLFTWQNAVHEVLVPENNHKIAILPREELVFKHLRQYGNKAPETGRNLRILRKFFEETKSEDARQMYYMGLECFNSGLIEESIDWLTKYVNASGWDDERVMACLKLVDAYQYQLKFNDALNWGFKAIQIQESWAEGYFAVAKVFYNLALTGGPNESRNWERCINFAKIGLSLPETKTLLFLNPLDRQVEIYRYLNMALNKLGRVEEALEKVNIALKTQPNDHSLLTNKKIYEDFLVKNAATVSINKLLENNLINKDCYDLIIDLFNNPDTLSKLNNKENNKEEDNKWNIPIDFNMTDPPLEMDNDQLESMLILLWKQHMLHNKIHEAVKFLENSLAIVDNSPRINELLTITKNFLNKNLPGVSQDELTFKSKLDIVFFAGDGVEEWNPDTVKKTGIGGSELMLLEQAKRFVKLGHTVTVYNSCGSKEGFYDGVRYLQTQKYHDLTCDVLIVSRRADMLADKYNVNSKLKLLWIHDVCAIEATNELLLKADRILALSEWHKQNLIVMHNLNPNHIIVTRNGIDLNRFNKQIKRNRFKCVNSSSPDRSWPILLPNIWPRVKEQVPEAELHLYYGFKNWEYSAQFEKPQQDLINYIKDMIKSMAPLGVVFHDRVNQEMLAEEYLSAGAQLYPTWFSETSNIGGMEAQAAGLRIISSSIAALNETIGPRGKLLSGEWTDKDYQDRFVEETVKALKNDDNSDRLLLQQYARENFGLDQLALDWEKMFFSLIDKLKTNPIVPYMPTVPYQAGGNGYYAGDTRVK